MAEVVLAPALRPFTAQIRLFDPAVPAGVGPWLLPLLHVLGPMRVPTDATTGDPDGYSGIARRGPYERLLASEWIFALDEPDEFIRRAVMDEHMFLARHFRDPSGATTSVALFDAGPLQLGAPRLAQIALLVVLARRAAAAGAVFRFGILQAPELGLVELDTAAIAKWTGARSWAPADAHLDVWRQHVAELAPSDLWVVGAEQTRSVAAVLGAHAVAIAERDGSTLHVQTHRRDAVGGAIDLTVPEPRVAIAVLREPVARRPMPDARTVVTQSSALGRLSLDGRRLMLPRSDGGVDALHIPGTAREPIGRTKQIPARSGYRLLACDIYDRRPIALYERGGALFVAGSGLLLHHRMSTSAASSLGELVDTLLSDHETALLRAPGELAQLHVVEAGPTKLRAWIVGSDRRLWKLELTARHDVTSITERLLEAQDGLCVNFTRQNPQCVAWGSGTKETLVTSPPLREWELHGGQWHSCVFGTADSGQPPTLAYAREGRIVVHHDGPLSMTPPPGRLFGLVWRYDSGSKSTPHLLYVDEAGQSIRWQWPNGDELLVVAPERIDEIRYEPWCRKILYRTLGGQRGVYAIERKALVWRSIPEAPR